MVNSLETARRCAEAADAKKALNVVILDLRKLTYITDYFVICSGSSSTHVSAISDGIGHALAAYGRRPSHVEGQPEASWILMDYGDVVTHIFDEQTRMHYALDKLWSDAGRVPLHEEDKKVKSAVS